MCLVGDVIPWVIQHISVQVFYRRFNREINQEDMISTDCLKITTHKEWTIYTDKLDLSVSLRLHNSDLID